MNSHRNKTEVISREAWKSGADTAVISVLLGGVGGKGVGGKEAYASVFSSFCPAPAVLSWANRLVTLVPS